MSIESEAGARCEAPSWWVMLLAATPFPVLYGVSRLLAWLAFRVFPYRAPVVAHNLRTAFPEYSAAQLRECTRRYYQGYADVLVEIIKSARLSHTELHARVQCVNVELAREYLQRGKPVLLLAAHQCNWEWMLLALSADLGWPLDAAYKPLVNGWAEREMQALRCRFGARLVPAPRLLADIIARRKIVRAIALVADQEPVSSEHKYWTRFLGRDSAFFLGAEELSRTLRYPALFVAMRRVRRGHYQIEFLPLADPEQETLCAGEVTERYVACVERQIRAAPADWPWSHKRWRLKKPLYD